MGKLKITSARHLKDIVKNKGVDPATRERHTISEVITASKEATKSFQIEDAMSTTNMSMLLPQVITQIVKEEIEPMLVGPSLLDRMSYVPGQRISFPAIGAITMLGDVAEGQAYPEVQIQMGGATVIAGMDKTGLAFKFTDELLRYSDWDLFGYTMRRCANAFARHKEKKIFNYIKSMGVPCFDNLNPTDSWFGTTTGRSFSGAANGSVTMDDIFDVYSQIIQQGFIVDTMLVHPLTYLMWVRDPVMRAFTLQNGGGTFFANYSGRPNGTANWSNGPQGALGMATGQNIVPGGNVSGDTPSSLEDYPQTTTSAPVVPSYFPYPLRIVVSHLMPFDPANKTTDIYLFDSSRLGALIVDQELTSEQWDDPSVDVLKVKMWERYGLGIYEEGQAIGVIHNAVVVPNEIVLPAQAQVSVSGSLSPLDRSTPISL